ncbi:hypothetical protein N7540_006485 [Penicillium herquei]|nr:hypothetical protein N7540_006485 [Penicillium herquei]
MNIRTQFPHVRWIWEGGISFIYEVHPRIVFKIPQQEESEREQFQKELEIYRIFAQSPPCPYIVQCYLLAEIGIFMEYMRDANLSWRIQQNHIRDRKTRVVTKFRKLETLSLRLEWVNDITQAVAFLESLNLAHGDLRPENVLLDRNKLKLSDFDCTAKIGTELEVCQEPYGRFLNSSETELGECGTAGFLGPRTEQFALGSLGHSLVLYELLMNMKFPPLNGNPLIDNIIKKCWHNEYATISGLAVDIRKLLNEFGDSDMTEGNGGGDKENMGSNSEVKAREETSGERYSDQADTDTLTDDNSKMQFQNAILSGLRETWTS